MTHGQMDWSFTTALYFERWACTPMMSGFTECSKLPRDQAESKRGKVPFCDFGVFNPSQWRSLCPTSNSSQSYSARLLFIWTSHLDAWSNMQSKSVNKLLINYGYLTTLKSVHGWVLFCYRWVPAFSSRVTNQVGITGSGFLRASFPLMLEFL